MRVHLAVLLAVAAGSADAQAPALSDSIRTRIDRVFAAFTPETPGCGVGVGRGGKIVYNRAFGLANLEYGIPATEQTVWESGSVAKQFTAGALVLLALDGKLSLEDDVRKYLPEVPSFPGGPITIRMLLNHTSGLRDQWGLLGLMNLGPGQQVHSPATTLDLVSRQKMLNFPPGTRYMYSNTGYTLAGLIVQRVSGKTLDAFTQERLFKPLGMTSTQWRDDHREVVKNRATAYAGAGRGSAYRTNMPFTDMIGNGGLLFTVDDMMKWLANLDIPVVGGSAWRDSLETRGRLKGGKTIPYALGLQHGVYNGVAEIGHGGSTAGYQTWVGRYPEQGVSVAVLCNVTTASPMGLARQVASVVLGPPPAPLYAKPLTEAETRKMNAPARLSAAELAKWTGMFRDQSTNAVIRFSVRDSALVVGESVQQLTPMSPTLLRGQGVDYFLASAKPKARRIVTIRGEDSTVFDEVAPADTSARQLGEYAGTYLSDELDAKLAIQVRNGALMVFVRPADSTMLRPTYKDGFTGQGESIRFTRDKAGKVTGLSVFGGRILDVRFRKISPDPRH